MIGRYDGIQNDVANQPRVKIEFRAQHPGWNFRSLGACAGLAGGIIAALVGSLLTAITWFTGTGAGSSYIQTSGTVLLSVTIPLLILGAHCLDLEEKHARKSQLTSKEKI